MLEKCGHMLHFENPEGTVGEMIKFAINEQAADAFLEEHYG